MDAAVESLVRAAATNIWQRPLYAAMMTELRVLGVTLLNDSRGRDQSVTRFCANWVQLKVDAPSAAVKVFVRLALQDPVADVPAQLLYCWQLENAAISSVGELRGVVAQLRAYKADSCQ